MIQKCVFFDRDGVLNSSQVICGKPFAPMKFDEFHIFPEASKLLESIKKAGFLIIVVTNQPDVGNGKTSLDEVNKMHRMLKSRLPIDDIFTCFHSQDDNCECRKPKPGMLFAASEKYHIQAGNSYFIGDRFSDVVAGKNFGCKTILIDRNYAEKRLARPDKNVLNLEAAIQFILKEQRKSSES